MFTQCLKKCLRESERVDRISVDLICVVLVANGIRQSSGKNEQQFE